MPLDKRVKNEQSKWMQGKGPMSDVVISSRARLARNLAQFSFPSREDGKQLNQVRNKIRETLKGLQYKLDFLQMEELSELEKRALVERHLISIEHATQGPEKGLAIDKDQMISIMVNEEDHLRIQVLFPGMQLQDALRLVDEVDDRLEEKLEYAFQEKWGYLTCCPTNLGTGLRVSVMVHLPGLNMTGRLQQTLQLVTRLGLAVRGLYGEGSESAGNLFQLSNQTSLGLREEEIIDNISGVIDQVVEREREARQYLVKEREMDIKDRVWRGYGALSYAQKISTEEAVSLLSDLKLGIDLGIIKEIDPAILSQLMVLIRPATLQRINNRELDELERDVKRAELIKKKMVGGG